MENVLDFQQAAAVHSRSRMSLVVAGAGAGKTRVLTERIAYLIESKQAVPSEILAVTFTRKAATEMADRIGERMGFAALSNLRIGTLHSMALRYIRMHGVEEFGVRESSLTVYNQWETDFLIKDTAKMVKAPPGYTDVMEEYWSTLKEPPSASPHRRFYEVFRSRLRMNNALSYGDLIVGMIKIVNTIAKRPLFEILVDEAQDLDYLQWTLLKRLAFSTQARMFLVGDIDQSIYEWRGAKPSMMLQYAENAEVFKLTNNYRSASGIVDAANRMIVKNTRRIEKSMIPAKRDPGTVRLVLNADTDLAVSLIRELTRNGVTPVSTAVLSRTHVLLARLSQELTAAGIMHTYCGRDNKLMNSEVFRRLHAISKLALNKYDNFSFALCRQIIGCSDAEYGEVITAAISGTRELTHLDIYLDMIEGSVHDRAEWCAFFEVGHRHDMETYHRILTNLVKRSMVLTDQDIDRGLSLLRSWRGTTLQGYLDWVTTYDLQEEVEPHQPGLQLMTVHAAKGLEFDQVLLLGWNEGILPGQHAIDAGDIEEERRIGYVATTRAIQTLVVTARPINKQARNGRVYEQPVSRFMYELQGVWKE